jgi:prepilin-type N-terminal cleavage/methylation domain-containing protein
MVRIRDKQMKTKKFTKEEGFTIVELMIALSILATILVMSTVILMSIGRIYARGVNAATLQNASRNISADIASAIQFSGSAPKKCAPADCGGTTGAICIGQIRYSYLLDRKLGTDNSGGAIETTPHVLWRDTKPSADVCTPVDMTAAEPSPSGYELIPENVRLMEFSYEETPAGSGVYKVNVRTAFGDTELLNAARSGCIGDKGNEYCGASRISTTVTRRVQ